jgi:hypothetical protein
LVRKMSELIQTKLNLYLPNDSVVREARPYNIFKNYPDLVIVSLTHPTISKNTLFNLKKSLYYLNYADDSRDWTEIQQEIKVETIDNTDFSLTFLSYGPGAPTNSTGYNYYRWHLDPHGSVIFRINSPEIKRKFPNLNLAVLCEPTFLIKQLSEIKTIENGQFPINYYFKSGGLYIDKFRIQFVDMNIVNKDQSIIGYSKRRSEGKFISRKNLVPGRVYTTTRTDYGTFFLYLGELDECLINKSWGTINVFDWENPYKAYLCYSSSRSNSNIGSLGGSLVVEYPYLGQADFHLRGLEFLTAFQTIIHGHNSRVQVSPFNGYDIRLIPKTSQLRGIEMDTLLQVNSSLSSKDIIKNYIIDNIRNKVYDFLGYNIMSSLVWDEIKGEKDFIDSLISRYACCYLNQAQFHRMDYPRVKESFASITGLPEEMLDDAVSKLNTPCP